MSENIEQKLNEMKEEMNSGLEKIKQEVADIGQNIIKFLAFMGDKVVVLEESISDLSGSIKEIKQDFTELKKEKEMEMAQEAELSELIKQTVTEEVSESEKVKATPKKAKPAPKIKEAAPITPKPAPKIPEKPIVVEKPSIVKKPPIVKPAQVEAEVKPAEEIPVEVLQIFDNISNTVVSKVNSTMLAEIMNHARDEIIKVYKWHPVLYELASFSRRIEKMPEGPLDTEITSLLLEKIEDWKNRISGE